MFIGNGEMALGYVKTTTSDWRFFSWSHPSQSFYTLIRQCLQLTFYNTIIALSLSLTKWSNFILPFLPSLWLRAQHWLPPATMSSKSIFTVSLQLTDHWYQRRNFRCGLACAGRLQSREFVDEEDLFVRDLDASDDLEAREPLSFKAFKSVSFIDL